MPRSRRSCCTVIRSCSSIASRNSKWTSGSSGSRTSRYNERYLSHTAVDGRPALPPTILTEVVAQVGAIMILAKPENRQRLILLAGIERVRYRRPVHAGDVVEIEATVLRLRSRMGRLQGVARVNGQAVIEGTMTFALGPPAGGP